MYLKLLKYEFSLSKHDEIKIKLFINYQYFYNCFEIVVHHALYRVQYD